jgi:protein-S-isoprenylcysteine O-methyltransferase Ste14
MNRWINFSFGMFAYAFGFGSLVLFLLFVGGWTRLPGLGELPWQIDAAASSSFTRALLINVGLVLLFGLQHSIMARPSFKQVWTRIIPQSIERSCYCVATGIVICLMCVFWQPLAGTVWHVEHPGLSIALTSLQLLGWAIVVASSFMINHFELFGLQQVYYRLVEQPLPKMSFTVQYLYRYVRHPLQMGMLIGIWATPHMSTSHMFLSAAMTIYITVGLYFEERDLAASLGQDYELYRRQVPMIVPKWQGLSEELETPKLLPSDSAAS